MANGFDFAARVAEAGEGPLVRGPVTTLQLNIGKKCNLACHHCHVDAGPKRTEAMDRRGAERILEVLAASPEVEVLDITGGSPELNENFRFLVAGARGIGRRVIDRCNLTVLDLPGQEETAEFLAGYMSLLVNHFNPETLPGLMCRNLVSVAYDGRLYDCDFNQNLDIEVQGPERTIWDLGSLSALEGRSIATASHCFGCTAGAGSSCSGSLA